MKIKVLTEDTAVSSDFRSEHGLSLYIETESHRILYDSGQSELYLENAEKMNVPIEDIDTVILSHGHYDHSGGLSSFLRKNHLAQIYMTKGAFGRYYNADSKFIGVDRDLLGSDRIIFTDNELKIDDELYLFTANGCERPFKMDNYGLTKVEDGEKIKDDFLHEQYLVIKEGKTSTLFSGCSHKGVLNILYWAKDMNVTNFVGGFHLMKVKMDDEGKAFLDSIATGLSEYDIMYYTGHCTGKEQYEYLKTKLKNKIQYISAGKEFNIK